MIKKPTRGSSQSCLQASRLRPVGITGIVGRWAYAETHQSRCGRLIAFLGFISGLITEGAVDGATGLLGVFWTLCPCGGGCFARLSLSRFCTSGSNSSPGGEKRRTFRAGHLTSESTISANFGFRSLRGFETSHGHDRCCRALIFALIFYGNGYISPIPIPADPLSCPILSLGVGVGFLSVSSSLL